MSGSDGNLREFLPNKMENSKKTNNAIPPDEKINRLIEVIYNKNILQKNGILVIHRKKSIRDKFPDCLKIIDERIYGISKIVFGKFLV